jgi:hypothetical protein
MDPEDATGLAHARARGVVEHAQPVAEEDVILQHATLPPSFDWSRKRGWAAQRTAPGHEAGRRPRQPIKRDPSVGTTR